MKINHFFWLLLVSAIWGASHSLVKISVAEWGSVLTTFLRTTIATVFLFFCLQGMRKKIHLRENRKVFLLIGLLNSALPLFLFAYAARSLPASYLVILNSTMPIFNAVLSSIFLKDPFTRKKVLGLIMGISGIVLLEEQGTILAPTTQTYLAMACALTASLCYASCSVYLKKLPKKIDPVVLTTGSGLVGACLLFPFAFEGNWHLDWNASLPSILVLGVLGSGLAFVIYYRLLEQISAFSASLSTFLMPVFGIFWGWLFLNETINLPMCVGAVLIISSTLLFLRRT